MVRKAGPGCKALGVKFRSEWGHGGAVALHMSLKRLLAAPLLLVAGLANAAPALTAPTANTSDLARQRQASLKAVSRHAWLHRDHFLRCADPDAEWHTDVVAFPASEAKRVYVYSFGRGYAYQILQGEAKLVWCGKTLVSGEIPTKYAGNAARALTFPLRTISGLLPVERGAMDIYSSFAGHLTTMRMNAAGKVVCSKERFDEGKFRSAFQFDARDTCP